MKKNFRLVRNMKQSRIKLKNPLLIILTDALDVFAGILLIVILALALLSTFYDFWPKLFYSGCDEVAHPMKILTIFSIKHNWQLLLAQSRSDDADLKFIDVFRVFATFGVIQNHCVLYSFMMPSSNPNFIEEVVKDLKISS